MPFGISISGFLLDALYDPWPTPLMKLTARDSHFSGKDLLVAQAIRQIEIFLELQLNRDDFFEKLRAII
jgi:shikimate 5-dehydrogenase